MNKCRRLPARGDPVRWPTVKVTRQRVMTSTAAWRGLSYQFIPFQMPAPTYHMRRVRGVGNRAAVNSPLWIRHDYLAQLLVSHVFGLLANKHTTFSQEPARGLSRFGKQAAIDPG